MNLRLQIEMVDHIDHPIIIDALGEIADESIIANHDPILEAVQIGPILLHIGLCWRKEKV